MPFFIILKGLNNNSEEQNSREDIRMLIFIFEIRLVYQFRLMSSHHIETKMRETKILNPKLMRSRGWCPPEEWLIGSKPKLVSGMSPALRGKSDSKGGYQIRKQDREDTCEERPPLQEVKTGGFQTFPPSPVSYLPRTPLFLKPAVSTLNYKMEMIGWKNLLLKAESDRGSNKV